jgi:hypothetical protein
MRSAPRTARTFPAATRSAARAATGLALALLASACTFERRVTPEIVQAGVATARLEGRIEYDGKPENLPRSLVRKPDADALFAYSTTTVTGRETFPQFVPFFNPLTLIGYPTKAQRVTVVGRLEILSRGRRLQGYDAQATIRRYTTLYSGDVRRELERDALTLVRDSIDAQLGNSSDALQRALGAPRR